MTQKINCPEFSPMHVDSQHLLGIKVKIADKAKKCGIFR